MARVLLEMHWPADPADSSWVDIHSLLRINGVWKDMNKTATHASRAGWAGAVPARGEDAAETPDRDEIVRVVQLYLDGFSEGDVDKCKQAFHPTARMFFTDRDGELANRLLDDECFAEWASDAHPVTGRFLSVIQAGDVASVLLGFGKGYVDVHNLLRIDGIWKITNKTATHVSRADWAGQTS